MNFVDQKFINLISVYLERFKTLNAELFTFRCPICGDSKKNKFKTRGYLYTFDDVVAFRCHNCSAGMSLANFIKHFSIDLWKQYVFERFYNSEKRTSNQREQDGTDEARHSSYRRIAEQSEHRVGDQENHAKGPEEGPLSGWQTIAELSETHPAKIYVQGRRIPEIFHHELYYTADLREVFKAIPRYSSRVPENASTALLIPFFDGGNVLQFIQARILSDSGGDPKWRYQTFQLIDGATKIWGLRRVDWTKRVWVFEGPIDAMMVPNGIAVASGSPNSEIKYLKERCQADFVFVYDNDYKTNYEVFFQFIKSIENGIPVVFFDKNFAFKDVNEAIQNGWSREKLHQYLSQHTKHGLSAQLALSEFKQPTIKK